MEDTNNIHKLFLLKKWLMLNGLYSEAESVDDIARLYKIGADRNYKELGVKMKKIAADRNYRMVKKAYPEWMKDWSPDTSVPVYIFKPMVVYPPSLPTQRLSAPLEVGGEYIFSTNSMPSPDDEPSIMMGKYMLKGYDNAPHIKGTIQSLTGGGTREPKEAEIENPHWGARDANGRVIVLPTEVVIAPGWEFSVTHGMGGMGGMGPGNL